MELAEFNKADRADASKVLRPYIDVQRWIDEIADAHPFATGGDLPGFARGAASPITSEEVAAALAHHPRIGERPTAAGAEAAMSRSEQAGVDPADATIADAPPETAPTRRSSAASSSSGPRAALLPKSWPL